MPCTQLADYEIMARALATIGACDVDVNFTAFARDLEAFFTELEQVRSAGGDSVLKWQGVILP